MYEEKLTTDNRKDKDEVKLDVKNIQSKRPKNTLQAHPLGNEKSKVQAETCFEPKSVLAVSVFDVSWFKK
ncbi:unnamed protein product [Rhizophagus irregularis]|nr:unnamed protein product [Rhizophagus irregularis]